MIIIMMKMMTNDHDDHDYHVDHDDHHYHVDVCHPYLWTLSFNNHPSLIDSIANNSLKLLGS